MFVRHFIAAALVSLVAPIAFAQQVIVDEEANANSGAELFGPTASTSFGIGGASAFGGANSSLAGLVGSTVATSGTTGTTGTTSTTGTTND
ncbi:hypothetical protein CVM52_13445 [Pseudooceanicola lipolyticus]|uniref:Uncharacterized protein n=1 Tax=Pseudooceanicola lipolyticus TaxID=2029104 RepID=A0A2M8J027_9RHOB|nr:hypothetical protein [Pseudooceanicola lipolyticus]PJE36146.1 hypothetical protein CVM52_13445 [Pseudooceanicola lipolyticus]